MLDYGFASYVHITLAKPNTYRLALPVVGGNDDILICTNTMDMQATIPTLHGEIICRVEAPRFILAPIEKGTQIGTISYYCDGKLISESPLISITKITSSVSKSFIWDFILNLFGVNRK